MPAPTFDEQLILRDPETQTWLSRPRLRRRDVDDPSWIPPLFDPISCGARPVQRSVHQRLVGAFSAAIANRNETITINPWTGTRLRAMLALGHQSGIYGVTGITLAMLSAATQVVDIND